MASPLWGKLSPQVTDEGATTGHFPLIRRVPRHLPPKGEGFPPPTYTTKRQAPHLRRLPFSESIIKKRYFSTAPRLALVTRRA